jgi:2-desacetyl-2-hydroxyethyl bacteriochlorophyllide A dehydrogenase
MRAIQIAEPKTMRRIEIDEPGRPGPGQALVRTHRMGVCGTDVSCYLGKFPFFDFPRIPGHELGVEVLEVGDGVTNVRAGDRCSVEPYMNCGKCFACRRGAGNCCANLKVIGVMMDGGLCDRFILRAEKLHSSKKLTMEQLALVETLAIGCHANDRGALPDGEHALIIGLGPIGLATLEFARLTAAKISVMDMNEQRLEFVRRNYGIENTIHFKSDDSELPRMRELTDGDMYSVVTDATGNKHSMSGALKYLAPTGTLVYVGITTEEVAFRHPVLHRPEATIKASRNALPPDFTRIIGLIENGTINTDPWITHRTSFDDVISQFDSFTRPETGVLKAMIELA